MTANVQTNLLQLITNSNPSENINSPSLLEKPLNINEKEALNVEETFPHLLKELSNSFEESDVDASELLLRNPQDPEAFMENKSINAAFDGKGLPLIEGNILNRNLNTVDI